ncbi:MAG: hypothetical protein AB1813_29950 [Verrucomicrobiota bacterium]
MKTHDTKQSTAIRKQLERERRQILARLEKIDQALNGSVHAKVGSAGRHLKWN